MFQTPTTVTKVHKDGRKERLRYGQYEAVLIVKENGWDVNRAKILIPPRHPVLFVDCEDGSRLMFDEPFYYIEQKEIKE